MRLRDDGVAEERGEQGLFLPWKTVAGLTLDEVRTLGLPEPAPFALEIRSRGAIGRRGFEIRCNYLRAGRRVMGVRRDGAWLEVGGEGDAFLLLDPLHSIVEEIEGFHRHRNASPAERMVAWARLAELLPGDALVDEQLRSLRISLASGFEIDPFRNETGEPDFDPVPGAWSVSRSETGEKQRAFRQVLDGEPRQSFARQFRSRKRVAGQYALGDGSYLFLTGEVRGALERVRKVQGGTAAERRTFLENPAPYIREGLAEADEAAEVDEVFSSDGWSDRIEGVGIWVRKVLPWIVLPKEPWLPPEAVGLLIDGVEVSIPREQLGEAIEAVGAAMAAGQATARFGGREIPANANSLAALERLVTETARSEAPESDSRSDNQVLVVTDNLEEVRYRPTPRPPPDGGPAEWPAPRLVPSTSLLPHQAEGLDWLRRRWDGGDAGALLADDMGLGKTLVALAFLATLKARGEGRPVLVVAPTGLLQNWRDEHDRHLDGGGLGEVVEAHGRGIRALSRRDARQGSGRGELRDARPRLDEARLAGADWVLTTYETLRDYQHSFGRVAWSVAVFDEAQKVKNPAAQVTDAVLAMNLEFALMMTGTPVENRTADLWSLLDRICPAEFGSLQAFSRRYESANGGSEAPLRELHGRLTGEPNGAPALMLRRLKEDHLPRLPEKRVHTCVTEMPDLQANAYAEAVADRDRPGGMLGTLHRLRSVSLHPFRPAGTDDDRYIRASARLATTFRILEEEVQSRGEKALLFVESREMQDFLIGALRRRFSLPEDVLVVNGAVSGRVRKHRVDAFQDRRGFDVMILSPRAGGVGLTLTAANHVIHLSRWWNPAVEDQCTDRVFRIGQGREVHVYLPLARHPDPALADFSFDLKLDALIDRKRKTNRAVLAPVASSRCDLKVLFDEVTQGPTGADGRGPVGCDGDVDQLEPEAFERWVLEQLRQAGYRTATTPAGNDGGADGLAWQGGHTLVLQCKHTQTGRQCTEAAVAEVLRAIPRYGESIRGEARPLVVTNAPGFSARARSLAKENRVLLVARGGLWRLSQPRGIEPGRWRGEEETRA